MPVSLCVLSAIVCIPGEIKLQLNNIFTRCCWTDSDARRPALRAPLSNYSSPGWVDRIKPGCPPGYPGVAHLHIACALSSLLYWWTHTPQDCCGVLFCWLKVQRRISEVRRTFVDAGYVLILVQSVQIYSPVCVCVTVYACNLVCVTGILMFNFRFIFLRLQNKQATNYYLTMMLPATNTTNTFIWYLITIWKFEMFVNQHVVLSVRSCTVQCL